MPTAVSAADISAALQTQRPPRSDRGVASLSSEDFFKIMISELRQQDPLSPAKTSDMISQVSQIRSIELSGKLTDTLDQIAGQQRTAGASDLLGKFVAASAIGSDGQAVVTEGVVTGVRYAPDGTAILDLDNGGQVPATAVTLVTTVEEYERMLAEGVPQSTAKSRNAGSPESTAHGTAGKRARSKWFSLDRLFRL